MTLRIALIGARGRMGTAIARAIRAADDLELAAEVGSHDDLTAAVSGSNVGVAVEFTVPSATADNVRTLVDLGIPTVVGTTGWDDARLEALRAQVAEHDGLGVLVAPNFAVSAVLAERFAAVAAPHFESVEVVEAHHPEKVDAPSGTGFATARAIGAARREAGLGAQPDGTATGQEARGLDVDGVPVHALRIRGVYAHEEIVFGGPAEQLAIRTEGFGPEAYTAGVLLAVRRVREHPGLTVGLAPYLGL